MRTKSFLSLFLTLLVLIFNSSSVYALSATKNKFFGQNNIIFYNPCDDEDVAANITSTVDTWSITVHGETVFDKFYYGLMSVFSNNTDLAKKYITLIHSWGAQNGSISFVVTHQDMLYMNSDYISDSDITLGFTTYTNDSTFLSTNGHNTTNQYIARLIDGIRKLHESGHDPIDDFGTLDTVSFISSYTPDSGTDTPYTLRPEAQETQSSSSSQASCSRTSTSTSSDDPENPSSTWSGDYGDYTPTGPVSGATTTLSWGGSSWTVVNTSIPVQTYASRAASHGLRQSFRDWPYSEVRNGKHGWNNQCINLAYTHTNGLRHGTDPNSVNVNVSGIPAIGGSLRKYFNTDERAFLAALYDQIVSGNPVVLMVGTHRRSANYSHDSRHFFTIVGFKSSITNPGSLQFTDLLAIDSWNANLMDMGSSNARKVLPGSALGQSDPGYRFDY